MTPLIEVNCAVCGRPFLKSKYRVAENAKRGHGNTCSKECHTKSRSKAVSRSKSTTEDVVLSRIDKTPGQGPNGDCWFWTGTINSANGYGYISWNARNKSRSQIRAHRVVYELLVGPIPEGLILMHSCDVRKCVNPAHLTPRSQEENDADRVEKGRQAKGTSLTRYPHMTDDLVRALKVDLRGGMKVRAAMEKYNVGKGFVKSIKYETSWKHITIGEMSQ